MNLYELMLIVDVQATEEQSNQILALIKDEAEKSSGTVVKVQDWGEKRLAYEINKRLNGHYYLIYFKATPEALAEITRRLKFNDMVIRPMFIKRENDFFEKQAAAAEKMEARRKFKKAKAEEYARRMESREREQSSAPSEEKN